MTIQQVSDRIKPLSLIFDKSFRFIFIAIDATVDRDCIFRVADQQIVFNFQFSALKVGAQLHVNQRSLLASIDLNG